MTTKEYYMRDVPTEKPADMGDYFDVIVNFENHDDATIIAAIDAMCVAAPNLSQRSAEIGGRLLIMLKWSVLWHNRWPTMFKTHEDGLQSPGFYADSVAYYGWKVSHDARVIK